MKYWHIHGLRIGVNERGAVQVAPNAFWSNHPQWAHEGYIRYGKCDRSPYDFPDIFPTDKFRSAAVPEDSEMDMWIQERPNATIAEFESRFGIPAPAGWFSAEQCFTHGAPMCYGDPA